MTVAIAHGPWRCVIDPDCGGAIAALTHAGMPVLRRGVPGGGVLEQASYPLVPFANRIGEGRLRFAGTDYSLDPDPLAAPHALHGHGWRSAWRVEELGTDRAVISWEHPGAGGWIWPYGVRQNLSLDGAGLTVEFAVTNRAALAMPVGTGLHPFFERKSESAIWANAATVWENDTAGLACREREDTTFTGEWVPVASLEGLDNFFALRTPVRVRAGGHELALGGSHMAGFHLYVPADEEFFCVEPVSHAPNAFGRGEFADSDVLLPGQTAVRRWFLGPGEPAGSPPVR